MYEDRAGTVSRPYDLEESMAKEEKHKAKEGKEHGKEGKPKLHLHKIIHTFAHDGSAMHEHVYKEHKDSPHERPPQFMGTSQDVNDLMQHDQDHAGPAMQGGEEEPEDDGAGAAPPQGEGAPAPQMGA
jgi:hypothetical protein